MSRVIVLDTLAPEGLEMLAAAPGIEHEVRTGLKGDACAKRCNNSTGRFAVAA